MAALYSQGLAWGDMHRAVRHYAARMSSVPHLLKVQEQDTAFASERHGSGELRLCCCPPPAGPPGPLQTCAGTSTAALPSWHHAPPLQRHPRRPGPTLTNVVAALSAPRCDAVPCPAAGGTGAAVNGARRRVSPALVHLIPPGPDAATDIAVHGRRLRRRHPGDLRLWRWPHRGPLAQVCFGLGFSSLFMLWNVCATPFPPLLAPTPAMASCVVFWARHCCVPAVSRLRVQLHKPVLDTGASCRASGTLMFRHIFWTSDFHQARTPSGWILQPILLVWKAPTRRLCTSALKLSPRHQRARSCNF